MRRRFVTLAVAAALLVSGCDAAGTYNVSPTPPAPPRPTLPDISSAAPHYSDALSGLYRAPASSVPADVPVNYYAPGARSGATRAVLTMALVPGANYARLRAYHAQVAKDAAAARPGQEGAIAEDLQIQPVLLRAVDIVKQRYPWLELMDDVATAQERNVSLTLVMDIRSRLGAKPGDPTAVQVEIVVFNEKRQPISRVETSGSTIAGDGGVYGFRDAAARALDALDTKSKALFN